MTASATKLLGLAGLAIAAMTGLARADMTQAGTERSPAALELMQPRVDHGTIDDGAMLVRFSGDDRVFGNNGIDGIR